ncbi:MAG: iron chaperone [Ginsengibacter sp.]
MDSKHVVYKSIDDYISGFPVEVQYLLQQVRLKIKELAPHAEEAISYGIPTFKLNGNLVHFAAFKNHIGLYPTPSGLEEFEKELSPYKQGKGSVQFPLDKPLPLDLIGKIVAYRVRKNTEKKLQK